MIKIFKSLRASWRYGKAIRSMRNKRYSDALVHVNAALALKPEDYMLTLHKALKGEIEYEIGNYKESRIIFNGLLNEFEREPDVWQQPKCKELIERVNWFVGVLSDKTT